MGDYLLLQWLGTRRGLAVFVLLLLMTLLSPAYADSQIVSVPNRFSRRRRSGPLRASHRA